MTRLTYTKFACIIIVHWCVMSIGCKIKHKQLKICNTKINGKHVGVVHTSVKLKLSCTIAHWL